jgi:hypothetical protein
MAEMYADLLLCTDEISFYKSIYSGVGKSVQLF